MGIAAESEPLGACPVFDDKIPTQAKEGNRLGWGTLTIIAWATRPLEEHADRRPALRTTAQKRKPTTPRIYNLSGRPAVAAVT